MKAKHAFYGSVLAASTGLRPRIPGDRGCTLFTTPEEQLQTAVEYISDGLERGGGCLDVYGEHEFNDFRAALKDAGLMLKRVKAGRSALARQA